MSPEQMSRRPRRLAVAAGVVGTILILGAGGIAAAGALAPTSTSTETLTLDTPVPRLSVDVGAGSLTVTRAAGNQVEVQRTTSSGGWAAPEYLERVTPGGAEVSAQCAGVLVWTCRVDYAVAVPDGFTLDLRSDSGEIGVAGLRAAVVDVEVSSGDVQLTDLAGPVRVQSSSGAVNGQRLAAASVNAEVSSGDVRLDFAAAPQTVTVRVSSGDLTLTLPPAEGYDLDVTTSSGEQVIGVPDAAGAARTVTLETSSGDVEVRGG